MQRPGGKLKYAFAVMALLLVLLSTAGDRCNRATAAPATDSFDRKIAPILAANCLECHSGAKPKGELDLSSRKAALAGGESGQVIAAGNPEKSLLWEHVREDEMPPKKPLPAA